MLRIAFCDDEKKWRSDVAALLNEYFATRSEIPAKVNLFASGDALIDEVRDNGDFDIYILDVLMPGMGGIDVGKNLRDLGCNGVIIYLTTSKEYAVDSYLTSAFHYLIKPIQKENLYNVLDRAVESFAKQRNKSISVKTKTDTRRLLLDDIIYVELSGKALCYHLKGGSSVLSTSQRVSFAEAAMPLLKDSRFTQCGASFVVNLFYVKSIEKESVLFTDGTRLALPRRAYAVVRSAWLDFWFGGGDGA